MARNFYTPINLNGLELQGAVVGNLSTTSINALSTTAGRIQYDSTLNVLKYRDNSAWQTISVGGGSFYLGSTSVSLGNTSGSITSITGLSVTGNAGTATTLATSRNINGVAFNGSTDITVKASTTYALGLTNSNLAFSSGTTWDGGTTGITIGLSATPTSITSINGVAVLSSGTYVSSATTSLPNVTSVNSTTIPSGATLLTSTSTASALTSVGTLTGLTMGGNIVMGSNKITGLGEPTNASDAATKNYVDNVSLGVNVHEAVAVMVDSTIAGTYTAGTLTANPPGDGGTGLDAIITYTATGTTIVDTSVTLAAGMRVLVTSGVTADSGTASKANGIYYVATAGTTGVATVLKRTTDYDNSSFGDVSAGDLIFVTGGASYAGDQFVQTVQGTATTGSGATLKYCVKIGTDAITFTQFSGSGAVPFATTTTAGIASFPTAQFTVATGAVTVASLAGSVINSSLVGATYGGTGVNNAGKTITLGGSLTTTGAFTTNLTATANTAITMPTTGTLATLAGSESLTGKTYNGLTISTSTGTLTVTNLKTLSVNNTLTLAGTDSTTMTFPSTSSTVMTIAQPGTLTGKPIFLTPTSSSGGSINLPSGVAVTSGWASGDVWNESGVLKLYNGSATKTVAFTDSAMTGTVNGTTIPTSATLLTSTTGVTTVNGSSGAITNVAVTNTGNTFTGTQTIQASATQDAIKLSGRGGGTTSLAVTLTPPTLAANQTLTLPNATATLTAKATGSISLTANTAAAITHNLNTQAVITQIFDGSWNQVELDVTSTNTTQVTVTSQATATYNYVIIG